MQVRNMERRATACIDECAEFYVIGTDDVI